LIRDKLIEQGRWVDEEEVRIGWVKLENPKNTDTILEKGIRLKDR